MIALGIALATVASFIASAVLYAIPPVSTLVSRTSTPRPGLSVGVQMASVVVRSLIASGLIAGILIAADWHGPIAGLLLGLALTALPLTLLMGGRRAREHRPLSSRRPPGRLGRQTGLDRRHRRTLRLTERTEPS
ncbi:hypothetical protein QFZ21_000485 [Microbacterium sp. W4I20]|nr:hypothetical protein [Microbacterium sp. W4I20]